MSADPPTASGADGPPTADEGGDAAAVDDPDGAADAEAPQARLERVLAENERLREQVAAAHRRRYRVTAVGLAVVGLIALAGAYAFPSVRTVLLALGGTGVFGAILTYVLTPERFVAASVGERIFGTLADNEAAIVADLDLRGEPVVLPAGGDAAPARLFVPLHAVPESDGPADLDRPDDEALATPFLTGDAQGLALQPTGVPLYRELVDAAGTLPDDPGGLAVAVGDALVEQFELVDGVDAAADPDGGRATLAVSGSAYGSLHRFDHPVPSALATALAVEFDAAVSYDVAHGSDRGDWLVTCRWD